MCICSLQLPRRRALVLCPKQSHKIEVVILNKVCILRFFVLNRVRVLNAQRLTYVHILVEYSPPPTPSQEDFDQSNMDFFRFIVTRMLTNNSSFSRQKAKWSSVKFNSFSTIFHFFSLAWAKFINPSPISRNRHSHSLLRDE